MKKPWWIIGSVSAAALICVGLVLIFATPAWAPPADTAGQPSVSPAPAPAAPPAEAAPPATATDAAAGETPETYAGEPGLGLDEGVPILGGGYVGSAKCKECHDKPDSAIYHRFMTYSRKSKAFQSVLRMKGLSAEEQKGCYRCHTTGYGKPTGFVSFEKTPYLADVGCEACHGPGRLHTQTMDMAHIVRKVTIDVCEKCHKDPKVKSFRYKGVIYAGAH